MTADTGAGLVSRSGCRPRRWRPSTATGGRSGRRCATSSSCCRRTARPAPGAEQLEFEAVEELAPGPKWKARFDAMWPAYRAWYLKDGSADRPDLATCRRALTRHMPELVPTYERLVELAGGDELAARLLSLYRPPGFVVGCSQGAWTRDAPVLVRNYDYPVVAPRGPRLPDRVERPPGARDERLPVGPARRGQRRRPCRLAHVRRPPRRRRRLRHPARRALPARGLRRRRGGARGARADPGPRGPEPHAARPLRRVPDRLRRARPHARVPRRGGHDQPPGQGRVAGVRARDPHGRARAARARAARRSGADPRAVRRRRSSSRRCATPSTRQGFGTIYTAAYYPAEGRAEYRWPGFTWEQSLDRFEETRHTETFTPS